MTQRLDKCAPAIIERALASVGKPPFPEKVTLSYEAAERAVNAYLSGETGLIHEVHLRWLLERARQGEKT